MDFYLDENLPSHIAKALNYLEGDKRTHNLYSTIETFGSGVLDIDLFPKISQANGVYITNDLKVAHKKAEAELLKRLSIGTFLIQFKQGATYWERVLFIMKNWEYIKETALYNDHKKTHYIVKLKTVGKPETIF
jgi:PIN like domain